MKKVMEHVHGFTLVETLVAMAICSIILAAVYSSYLAQQETYVAQEQVSEMQQNVRSGMYFMSRDIRMAGYDPLETSGATFTLANATEVQFTADINGDGNFVDGSGHDSNEQMRYALTSATDANGVAQIFPCNLGKAVWDGALQPVAENVEAIEFYYHLASSAPAPLERTSVVLQADRDLIRAIDVSLLVRTGRHVKKYEDKAIYYPASNPNHDPSGKKWGPFNDSFRRRLLITRIKCRNMGLK